MLVQKIKINKNESVSISYKMLVKNDEKAGEIWNSVKLTSEDRPASTFFTALSNLKPHIVEICELPKDDKKNIVVNGATFTYAGEDNILGARILGLKVLHGSDMDLDLITPHKIEEPYSESDGENKLFSPKCVNALKQLIQEAEAFIQGERDQYALELVTNSDNEEEEDDEIVRELCDKCGGVIGGSGIDKCTCVVNSVSV